MEQLTLFPELSPKPIQVSKPKIKSRPMRVNRGSPEPILRRIIEYQQSLLCDENLLNRIQKRFDQTVVAYQKYSIQQIYYVIIEQNDGYNIATISDKLDHV